MWKQRRQSVDWFYLNLWGFCKIIVNRVLILLKFSFFCKINIHKVLRTLSQNCHSWTAGWFHQSSRNVLQNLCPQLFLAVRSAAEEFWPTWPSSSDAGKCTRFSYKRFYYLNSKIMHTYIYVMVQLLHLSLSRIMVNYC